jgi:exosome complex exonuclease RRP6
MVKYAREDTHYLLYVYDRMRNELIRRGDEGGSLLQQVLVRSRDVCLRQYQKPQFSDTDYYRLYLKHKRKFNSQQVCCVGVGVVFFDCGCGVL